MRYGALIKALERILERWPSVLIPLLADYASVRVYQWDPKTALAMPTIMEGLQPVDLNEYLQCEVSRYQIVAGATRLFRLRSLGSLEDGPRKWAMNVEFSEYLAEAHVGVGIGKIGDRLSGVWFNVEVFGADRVTTLRLDGCKMRKPTREPVGRIYVSIDKRRKTATFQFQQLSLWDQSRKAGGSLEGLGVLPLPGNLEDLYINVSISTKDGNGCAVTLVDQ